MPFFIAFLLIALSIAVPSPERRAQGSTAFQNFEYQVTEDAAFGVYKPKGWKAATQNFPNGRMVILTDPQDTCFVSVLFLEKIDPGHDSVSFAGATLKNVRGQMAGFQILEARSSRDRMRTVIRYQRTGPGNVLMEGKYSFNVRQPAATVFGYEAPSSRFQKLIPTFMNVVANVSLLDAETYQKIASQRKEDRPALPPLRQFRAPDGTCRLMAPEGWSFKAEKGAALCASPDGDTGFLFTVIDFVGQSRIPYFSSSSIPGNLRYNYMPPTDALLIAMKHFGSTGPQVLERYPSPAAAQAASSLKRKVEGEMALVSYTSRSGTPCIGYYDVLGLPPSGTGQWGIIVTGIWAPKVQFGLTLATLIKVSESYQLNQQWAAEYVRQGMANVRALMQKTSSMMSRYAEEMRQSSLAAHQNRMKSSDYISYKFSTYMRGEQEWVTSLEGGKIYKSDHFGLSSGGKTLAEGPPFNYYNYEGDVRYGHIPVDISREVYEAVKGK